MAVSIPRPDNQIFVSGQITNISTSGTFTFAAPCNGKVVKVQSCIDAPITTANNTIYVSKNGTLMTNGTITVAFSGAATGDVDSCEPSAGNDVTEGDTIRIQSNGNSAGGTIGCGITAVIQK